MKELTQALQFYADNDLNEIISEKTQNRFAEISVTKIEVTEQKTTPQFFAKPVFSTNEALSNLAKKSHNSSHVIFS